MNTDLIIRKFIVKQEELGNMPLKPFKQTMEHNMDIKDKYIYGVPCRKNEDLEPNELKIVDL